MTYRLESFLKVFQEAGTFQMFPQRLIREAATRITLPLCVLSIQFQGKTKRIKTDATIVENDLVVPQKIQHIITI